MSRALDWRGLLLWLLTASACFHLAYLYPPCAFLIGVYLFALLQLSRHRGRLGAMNSGWALGFLVCAPHLAFFWTLFGPAAIALWMVLGFWLGLFLALLRFTREKLGVTAAAVLAPVLWMGTEFFRSELYVLRFTWLNAGYAFAWSPGLPRFAWLGVYGIGFVLMTAASGLTLLPPRRAASAGVAALLAVALLSHFPRPASPTLIDPGTRELRIAGMQVEFPDPSDVPSLLERLRSRQPDADLYILPEYTFQGTIPTPVLTWCREHRKHLLVGGKEPAGDDNFFNTAYVVDPEGRVVFQQAKSQPIQFFKDGLPAPHQHIWESPWGRLGVCICYDFSYARVVDELARQGAEALLVPWMSRTGENINIGSIPGSGRCARPNTECRSCVWRVRGFRK